jgi:phospholipid/cholesterol/gamma-HCH transport system substrate-binding protein
MKRSSRITWDQLRVGSIALVALGILTLAVYKLGQAASLFAHRYELIAIVPEANGLREGGPVSIAGQMSGIIKKIEFLPVDADTARNIKLVLAVNDNLKDQIRRDSRGKIRTMGLLGDKIVDISTGTPRYPRLDAGDTLTIARSLDYEAVLAQAAGAVGDVVELTSDLKMLTGGIVRGEGTVGQLVTNRQLYDDLTRTLNRTNAVLARLQNPNGTMGRLLDDPALYERLVAMITSTDSLVHAMTDANGTTGRMMRDSTLYTNLVGMTQRADSLMKMLTSGNGFASKMLTDQSLYEQLQKLVTDLNAILADVRRDPGRYTKGMIRFKIF